MPFYAVTDVVTGGGNDNSGGLGAGPVQASPAIPIMGAEQVALLVSADAASAFAAGSVKVQKSNDGTNWSDLSGSADTVTLTAGTQTLANCNSGVGPSILVVTPTIGRYLSVQSLRVVYQADIAGAVTGFTVKVAKFPPFSAAVAG